MQRQRPWIPDLVGDDRRKKQVPSFDRLRTGALLKKTSVVPSFCHPRRLSPTFLIGDPIEERIQGSSPLKDEPWSRQAVR